MSGSREANDASVTLRTEKKEEGSDQYVHVYSMLDEMKDILHC
jgi:hypothetical protein